MNVGIKVNNVLHRDNDNDNNSNDNSDDNDNYY